MSDHLRSETSNRGFAHMPPIPATYADQPAGEVRVYESSAAMAPHIWLDVKERFAGSNSHTSVQLTVADARKLAEQIVYVCDHHYQGDNPL